MTIERVLHVLESGKMDFYSSSYFATMADAPFLYKEGAVIGYGKEGDEYVAVNLSRARSRIENWNFGPTNEQGAVELDSATYAPYLISKPHVPPSRLQVSETEYEHETTYMDHWLSAYNGCTPKYVCPDREKFAQPVSIDGSWEALVADPDNPSVLGYLYDFIHHTIRADYTLPICNGFACFPKVVDRRLFVPNIMRYYQDPSARNRGMILVDFDKLGGCQFVRMKTCKVSKSFAITVSNFDRATQSLIVVLRGRILTPDKYTLVGNSLNINATALGPMTLMDEQVCGGALLTGPRVLTASVDMEKAILDDNSFFVIVNKPNLQIVIHRPWWSPEEPIRPEPMITGNSFHSSHRTEFDQYARGLLVDRATLSVYDYVREEHTVTFYAETSEPISWKASTVTVIPERPLVMLGSGKDNFMSAKGMLFTKPTDIALEDHIVWPRYAIYDFVFRG